MIKKEALNKAVEELSNFIGELGEFAGEIIFTPYGKLKIQRVPRTTYYFRLKKFERLGLVKKAKQNRGSDYVLTEKAKYLRTKPRIKNQRSDSLSTIVIFDIPEEKHKARDNFRRYLIKNGYTQIQKSVFISPFKVFEEMNEFVKELGIEHNVTFLSGRIDQKV